MKNIFEESEKTGRGIVNTKGRPVRIYTKEAKGQYPVHGVVIHETSEQIAQWSLDGTGPYKDSGLTLYSIESHFPWDWLPIWANSYIFKRDGVWYCSSISPKWDDKEGAYKAVQPHTTVTIPLPDAITVDILLTVDDKNSLFLNPNYAHDEV